MATKIRGGQIETDDFIKSVRNMDTDWTNDVNTASQKAIAALVSGKFKVVTITYDSTHDVYSSDTSINDIISWAANGYYVVALYSLQQAVRLRGVGIIFVLSYFDDLETFKSVEFRNIGYHEYNDTMECLTGKRNYQNGQWTDDDWNLEPHQISYTSLVGIPTNLVNSYAVINPALTRSGKQCEWNIPNTSFGNKSGEKAICVLKIVKNASAWTEVKYCDVTYSKTSITIYIAADADIAAGTYEAVIHA